MKSLKKQTVVANAAGKNTKLFLSMACGAAFTYVEAVVMYFCPSIFEPFWVAFSSRQWMAYNFRVWLHNVGLAP